MGIRMLWGLMMWLAGLSAVQAQQAVLETRLFAVPGARSRLQAAWRIDPVSLHYYRAADSTVSATFETEIRIYHADTALVKTERWVTHTPRVYPGQVPALKLVDGFNQTMPPGRYRLELTLTEPGFPERALHLRSADVVVKPFAAPALSQILLADTLFPAPRPSGIFVRGQQFVLPLVSAFADEGRDSLRYYAEAYAPEGPPVRGWKLQLRIGRSGSVPGLVSRTDVLTFRGQMAPVYGAVFIGSLPTGNYTAEARLLDRNDRVLATETVFFQRLARVAEKAALPDTPGTLPDPAQATDSVAEGRKLDRHVVVENTFLEKYKPAQLKALLRMVMPIARPDEALALRTLQTAETPPELMRNFLYAFFSSRNRLHPEKFWQGYSDEVRTVNRLFNLGARAGYSTDRGRMYLQYGPPAERIPVVQERGSRPYEIWKYPESEKQLRGGTALFVQVGNALDDYLLLHTTLEGEPRNRLWREVLYTEGKNENARAESYFPER